MNMVFLKKINKIINKRKLSKISFKSTFMNIIHFLGHLLIHDLNFMVYQ